MNRTRGYFNNFTELKIRPPISYFLCFSHSPNRRSEKLRERENHRFHALLALSREQLTQFSVFCHFLYWTFSDFLSSTSELASDDRSVLSFSFIHFLSVCFARKTEEKSRKQSGDFVLYCFRFRKLKNVLVSRRALHVFDGENFEIQYFDFISFVFLVFLSNQTEP